MSVLIHAYELYKDIVEATAEAWWHIDYEVLPRSKKFSQVR